MGGQVSTEDKTIKPAATEETVTDIFTTDTPKEEHKETHEDRRDRRDRKHDTGSSTATAPSTNPASTTTTTDEFTTTPPPVNAPAGGNDDQGHESGAHESDEAKTSGDAAGTTPQSGGVTDTSRTTQRIQDSTPARRKVAPKPHALTVHGDIEAGSTNTLKKLGNLLGHAIDETLMFANRAKNMIKPLGDDLIWLGIITGQIEIINLGEVIKAGNVVISSIVDEINRHEIIKTVASFLKTLGVDDSVDQAKRSSIIHEQILSNQKWVRMHQYYMRNRRRMHATEEPPDTAKLMQEKPKGISLGGLDQSFDILVKKKDRQPVTIMEPDLTTPILNRAHETGRNLYQYGNKKRKLFHLGSLHEMAEHVAPLTGIPRQVQNVDVNNNNQGVGNSLLNRWSGLQRTL